MAGSVCGEVDEIDVCHRKNNSIIHRRVIKPRYLNAVRLVHMIVCKENPEIDLSAFLSATRY